MSARILLLALGNPERGDDGIGPAVAARLHGRLPPGVALRLCSGDVLGLVEEWRDLQALVCVDASTPQGEPGRIRRLDLAADELFQEFSLTSSHGFGLAEAVGLARALGTAPPRMVVYAVEGSRFTVGTSLSGPVAAALDEVAARIFDELVRLAAEASACP
ncbi:hydrogenase maturation protease [Azotobacter salinestris]|uniref:hydrogenase maturation protease n=1 Tax=Azotobacter salinestris TaxID=69964 RepID=UPI0032DFDD7A